MTASSARRVKWCACGLAHASTSVKQPLREIVASCRPSYSEGERANAAGYGRGAPGWRRGSRRHVYLTSAYISCERVSSLVVSSQSSNIIYCEAVVYPGGW